MFQTSAISTKVQNHDIIKSELSLIISKSQKLSSIFHYVFGYTLCIVCILICGIGYTIYKKIFKILTDIDKKCEGRLTNNVNKLIIQLNKIEIKHQEKIQKLENKIKMLEDVVDNNLKHTKSLTNDLNYKINFNRSELEIKHQEKIQKLENKIKMLEDVVDNNLKHTKSLTNDLNDKINVTRTMLNDEKTKNSYNYAQINDMKKEFVTQKELEDTICDCVKFEETEAFIQCIICSPGTSNQCNECIGNRQPYKYPTIMQFLMNPYKLKVIVIKINKKNYYYSETLCNEGFRYGLIIKSVKDTDNNNELIKDIKNFGCKLYECGRRNIDTKKITWH
jgi:hypothetical protein